MTNIKEITSEQFKKILDHSKDASNIGLFFVIEKENCIVGIDNSRGDCFTENFKSLTDCIYWLLQDQDETCFIRNDFHIEFLKPESINLSVMRSDYVMNIDFLTNEHEKRYFNILIKSNVHPTDMYRLALIYVLTSHDEFYNNLDCIYDFNKNQLKSENFEKLLSHLSQTFGCMFRLAIKLYNDSWFKSYDFLSNIDYLDEDFKKCFFQALKLRFY